MVSRAQEWKLYLYTYVVYGGEGLSKGITHMLEASELACYAMPQNDDETNFSSTTNTRELDQILAMRFSWWDIFTQGTSPL